MKKQYSFRLRDTDKDLGEFISDLSGKFKSESEAIRQMLLFAHKHLIAEREQSEQISQIQHDLKHLIEQQTKYNSEILKSIESANMKGFDTNKEVEDEEVIENVEADKIAEDTAKALLGGFGMDFD